MRKGINLHIYQDLHYWYMWNIRNSVGTFTSEADIYLYVFKDSDIYLPPLHKQIIGWA